jgi:8-oxo-dGTP diphosphatase
MPSRREVPPGLRAGGGVVWQLQDGVPAVALVHRPRYDDRSLPKGKLEQGESLLLAAVREVREELGAQVAVSRRIGDFSYETSLGRKTVTYWVMRHLGGAFEPSEEVDAAQWVAPKAARKALSYEVDRRVLEDFVALPVPDSVIVLVRHAKAGRRAEWRGDDRDRPLENAGTAQAQRLGELLAVFAPDHIFSVDLARCTDTVAPLAERLGLPVQTDAAFGDEAFHASASATEDALMALAKPGRVSIVCSQGDAIPGLIDRLGRGARDSDTRKAAFWVLSIVDGTVVSTDYYEDAVRAL